MSDLKAATQKAATDHKNTLYCSFCGKSQHNVKKLIAGPTVFICNECIFLCFDILAQEEQSLIACEHAITLYVSRLNESKRSLRACEAMDLPSESMADITVGELLDKITSLLRVAETMPERIARLQKDLSETDQGISDTKKSIVRLVGKRQRIQKELAALTTKQ